MDLTLNTTNAREADQHNASVSEPGKYAGTITRAEAVTSKQGTKGIEIAIKTDDGATADYLTIWVQKANGEELSGIKAVSALLTCLKLKGAKTGTINTEKWDSDDRQRIEVQVDGYPDMMGKKIGVVLQKELYTKNNGSDGAKMNIVGFFEAGTEFTAGEILDKATTPKQLEKTVAWLMTKPVKDNRKSVGASVPHSASNQTDSFADMDSDIPFMNSLRGVRAYLV